MGKILGSWSGVRKYLEQEMLAECLKGRIRYNCTTYVGMDGCKIFEIFVDNTLIKQFSLETVNTYFINNGLSSGNSRKHHMNITEYWDDFWETLDRIPMDERKEYTDGEFCDALEQYRNQSIQESICSNDPLVRMFAVLDRRIGKRTITNIINKGDIQPQWLQYFYNLRFEAENI